jgi:hypothetical protein
VEQVAAVNDEIHTALSRRAKRLLEAPEEVGATPAPLHTRSFRHVEAEVGVREKEYPDSGALAIRVLER